MIGYPYGSHAFIMSAAFDYAGVGSLVAGITAVVALWFGHKNNKRAAINTETVSYVDNNLKTMQVTLDWLTNDNKRLRETNEEQRLQLVNVLDDNDSLRQQLTTVLNEVDEVKAELIKCKEECALMNRRLDKQIGQENESS